MLAGIKQMKKYTSAQTKRSDKVVKLIKTHIWYFALSNMPAK